MKQFNNLLNEINNKLNLPQPLKSRVILEIAGDMEEMYSTYVNRGLSEKEAESRTIDKFAVSDDTLEELTKIHLSAYQKWLDKLSQRAQTTWEHILLALICILVLYSFVQVASSTPFFNSASKFVYPILLTLISATILFTVKFYQLYIKKDHNLKNIRYGLDWMLYLCVTALFLGMTGYFGEMYLSSGSVQFLGPYFIISLLTDSDTLHLSVEWMMRSSAMLMTCCASVMLILLFWFTLINKAGKIEEAEASILLDE